MSIATRANSLCVLLAKVAYTASIRAAQTDGDNLMKHRVTREFVGDWMSRICHGDLPNWEEESEVGLLTPASPDNPFRATEETRPGEALMILQRELDRRYPI